MTAKGSSGSCRRSSVASALRDGADIDRSAGRAQDHGMCMTAASIVSYYRRLN